VNLTLLLPPFSPIGDRVTDVKFNLLTVIAVALLSSLATLGLQELFRGQSTAVESNVTPTDVEIPADQLFDQASPNSDSLDVQQRLAELEQRFGRYEQAQIERATIQPPIPETSADPTESSEDLRAMVHEWIAEEREIHEAELKRQRDDQHKKNVEFDARYDAHLLAIRFDLASWEEDKLQQLFTEVEIRRHQTEQGLDPRTMDPEEMERIWEDFDQWADGRYQEMLGSELVDRVFTDEPTD
jgi:hypothetical protein